MGDQLKTRSLIELKDNSKLLQILDFELNVRRSLYKKKKK